MKNAATYTVSQINKYIKNMMDEDVFLSGFFMEAEISNFKGHSSGHLYFTLKDSNAAINGVMFRGNAVSLEFVPENGMKVVAFGRVSAYEKTGAYQFYAEMMQPLGIGGLFLAFSRLKVKLEAEGLFDISRKKPIPRFPACIGIVTSADGAALRDIINVANRRNPRVKLVIAPALVQGAGAAEDIARAVGMLNDYGAVDCIIVGRGGGSIEDLWAFNEEVVARAVAASRIPVVSAVGHETDYTICDFTADLRAPTPSAAAEMCIPEAAETAENVKWLFKKLNDTILSMINKKQGRLDISARLISKGTEYKLKTLETRVKNAVHSLDAVAPLNVLKRGYGLLYVDGKAVRSVDDVADNIGNEMAVKLIDGYVYGNVTEVAHAGEKEADV